MAAQSGAVVKSKKFPGFTGCLTLLVGAFYIPFDLQRIETSRARPELAENDSDLALFLMTIDSEIRCCEIVKMKVADVLASSDEKFASFERSKGH